MLVRTRSDFYPYYGDEWRDMALGTGATIITTDFPPRDDLRDDPYTVTLTESSTVRRLEHIR